jgi:hypothetical protein
MSKTTQTKQNVTAVFSRLADAQADCVRRQKRADTMRIPKKPVYYVVDGGPFTFLVCAA